jgi:hypothetical protein
MVNEEDATHAKGTVHHARMIAGSLFSNRGRLSPELIQQTRFAGDSMRPGGFEPPTRGLEVRRSVH